MRKAARQLAACAAILLVFCAVCRLTVFSGFSLYVQLPPGAAPSAGGVRLEVEREEPGEDPAAFRLGVPEVRSGYVRVPILPQGPGKAYANVLFSPEDRYSTHPLAVDRFRTVYDLSTGNFTGDTAVLLAITLFWLLVSAIMMWHFHQAKGASFYDHSTIYYAGFSLFALATGLVLLRSSVSHIAHPEQFSMYSVYGTVSGASTLFMLYTMPLMVLFALAMAVSNVVLLRHEHGGFKNALGLLVSALLIAGEALGWHLFTSDFMGSEWEGHIRSTLENTYATLFVYFQCMLVGAVICGVKASRRKLSPGVDVIIILGCWFRPDGTLPPLLRGRVDRAVAFWRRQKEETGREAVFIPSGGQGENEPMAEAEAMRACLLQQGIPDRLIVPETGSANTLQNMINSARIIRDIAPGAKVAFATTSYHVFRSGLLARRAGLKAEGMGSRTRWWFWPNAFMRETVGLLFARWKQEVLFLVLLMAFFGALSMVL